jgi:hypothetical protein
MLSVLALYLHMGDKLLKREMAIFLLKVASPANFFMKKAKLAEKLVWHEA